MTIGSYIKTKRINKGITQEELAIKTNINIRTIQRIENGEVTPRAYSLRAITDALEIDFSELEQNVQNVTDIHPEKENKSLLVFLHLSGLLLLPAAMIWLFEKDRVRGVRKHGVDVINFQLSMLAILLPLLFLPFLAILLAVFTTVAVVLNTFKVMLNRPYHYPLTISFLKMEDTLSISG